MNQPTTTAKLTGAPCWVEKDDIKSLFERYGSVVSTTRGTSELSTSEGVVGDWGSGWVWSGEWLVRIKIEEDCTLPRFIQVNGGAWEIRVDGSPPACFKCGDYEHRAGECQAAKRDEPLVLRWEEDMGQSVEIFFPTQR